MCIGVLGACIIIGLFRGFLCPCHGSTFDIACRVYAYKPAADNHEVPRHMYITDSRIVIGRDENGEA